MCEEGVVNTMLAKAIFYINVIVAIAVVVVCVAM
jgi:hypothetical protein